MQSFIDHRTSRGYPKPDPANPLEIDAKRIADALDAIDQDISSSLAFGFTLATDQEAKEGTVTNKITTPANVNAAISAKISEAIAKLIGGAPETLNTLKELADALSDDQNLAAQTTAALATKASLSDVQTMKDGLIRSFQLRELEVSLGLYPLV